MAGFDEYELRETATPYQGRDREDKFAEYEKAGVGEYWLIDPDKEEAEFYRLADNGHYQTPTPQYADKVEEKK